MSSTARDDERDHPPGHPFWSVPSILLAIVVLASPLMIGGVHATVAAIITALSLAGLWWALRSSQNSSEEATVQTAPVALSIPTLAFGLMALFCLVQLLPLPTFLYRLVQPAGYEALISNWEVAFGGDSMPGWHLLSLDPRATAGHGLKWLALSAATALAGQVIVGRRRRRQWLGLLLVTGGIVALVGGIQHFSGTPLILGLYDAELKPRSISPFVNINHAASYFALMVITAGAYSLDHLRSSPLQATLGVGAALVALFLSAAHGSDGALVALGCGLGVLGAAVLTRTAAGLSTQRRRLRLVVLIVLLVGVAAAALAPDDWTLAEEDRLMPGTSAETRVHMATAALIGAKDYPVMGSGAGSVERVLPPYLDWHRFGYSSVPTVENEPAEWVLTMGPLIALITLLIFIGILRQTAPHILRKEGRRGPVYASAFLIFLGVVSFFHFPFFTLGISLVAAVAVESSVHQKYGGLHIHHSPKMGMLFALALTVSLGGLLGARATVLVEGVEESLDMSDADEVRRAMHLYPTDAVLLSALSLQARGQGELDKALTLARRAFLLRPHPQQEFLLARTLAVKGDVEESAEIYRSLLDSDRLRLGLHGQIQSRLRRDLPTAELRARAYSQGDASQWNAFARQIETAEGHTAAIDFALSLVSERPDRSETHLTLIERYRRADQVELAEMYARALVARNMVAPDGSRPAGLMELLDIMQQDGRAHEGRSLADIAFAAGIDSPRLARAILELRPQHPRDLTERDRRLFSAAVGIGCRPPYERSHRSQCWIARAYMAEAEGNIEEAESLLERVERHYDDPRHLAAFFARRGQCQELAGVQRRYGDGRYSRALQAEARNCARWE